MADDDVSAQLTAELRDASARALKSRRPLLTHLNADTTWLLSLPVPGNEDGLGKRRKLKKEDLRENSQNVESARNSDSGKAYFHILIDPWLRGSQSDVAQFFSQQWHAQESACQSIAEVEDAIRDIEQLSSISSLSASAFSEPSTSLIDAVVISHEFTDHMHKETLLEVDPSTPLFASSKAASIIKSWKHFSQVQPLSSLTPRNTDWRSTSVPPLPRWIGIGRLAKDGVDLLYYHSAVLITFSASEDGEERPEAVIYTPHGITPEDLTPLAISKPEISTLALMHGLHDISVSAGQLNLGAHNGLKAQRLTGAKYWLGTHDEVKRGAGLVSWFLKRRVLGVKEALEQEVVERGLEDRLEDVIFIDVANGESLILE
jgi:hypothetical protein